MAIWLHVECDCGTEFKVKPPECCFEDKRNSFTLNCPYCEGDVGYEFQFNKSEHPAERKESQ